MSTAVVHADVLRHVPLFARLRDRDVEAIAARARVVRHDAGHVVVSEGHGGLALHVILSGTATVSVAGTPRRTLAAGDYFGEISLIDGRPRTATVQAQTDLETLAISSWDFHPLLREQPEIARALLFAMCDRVRDLEAALARATTTQA